MLHFSPSIERLLPFLLQATSHLFGYDPVLCFSICPAPLSLDSILYILQCVSFSRFPPLVLTSGFHSLFAHLCPCTCRWVCRFFFAKKLPCPDFSYVPGASLLSGGSPWPVRAEVRTPSSSCIRRRDSIPWLDLLSCWLVKPCTAHFSMNGWCKLLLVPFRACVARSFSGKENQRRFAITCRFQLFPTPTHCTKSIAVALRLLYLWVFSISLSQEPL